ncbi:hypothetical protein SO802_024869 [Lithocarpus litseifolius]|uniref:TIR domain-containing protein n=1 Tax=Lithocarpus litseifolius TaxID=425828 RepID=A0AAW2CAG6_9ROSI
MALIPKGKESSLRPETKIPIGPRGIEWTRPICLRDDEKLERITFIAPELLSTIEDSRFAVVILSRDYASSSWCLIELAKIVECMEKKGLIVLPVFHYVDPSDVRN